MSYRDIQLVVFTVDLPNYSCMKVWLSQCCIFFLSHGACTFGRHTMPIFLLIRRLLYFWLSHNSCSLACHIDACIFACHTKPSTFCMSHNAGIFACHTIPVFCCHIMPITFACHTTPVFFREQNDCFAIKR